MMAAKSGDAGQRRQPRTLQEHRIDRPGERRDGDQEVAGIEAEAGRALGLERHDGHAGEGEQRAGKSREARSGGRGTAIPGSGSSRWRRCRSASRWSPSWNAARYRPARRRSTCRGSRGRRSPEPCATSARRCAQQAGRREGQQDQEGAGPAQERERPRPDLRRHRAPDHHIRREEQRNQRDQDEVAEARAGRTHRRRIRVFRSEAFAVTHRAGPGKQANCSRPAPGRRGTGQCAHAWPWCWPPARASGCARACRRCCTRSAGCR